MKTVTIIFKNNRGGAGSATPYNGVNDVIYHTYGFVELCYGPTLSEQFNLEEIFSIKVESPDETAKR